ncbi:MAG: hypothetical protein LBS19_14740 [Clostridiales bacterium]|jgi:hypothetical protein|nr:hypothetical protein [Clostridiales bacterium]
MKKSIYSLTVLILSAVLMCAMPAAVSAAETGANAGSSLPVLSDVKTTDGPGIRYMIKSYEAAPDYDPDFALLVEEPFEHEGLRYTFQYVSANEVLQTDRKWERDEVNFPVDNEDIQPVFQRLEPSIPYRGEDGYAGTLDLDLGAVWVQIMAYTNKSYTLTDTVTIGGLSSNDTSNIPKTREKSGVTLTLENVDWTVQESSTIGYDSVPTKYTATAHYSGSYSKKVPSEYLARAWYGGYVEKTSVAKVVYSITYAAELPSEAVTETAAAGEPVSEPAAVPAPELETEAAVGEQSAETSSSQAPALGSNDSATETQDGPLTEKTLESGVQNGPDEEELPAAEVPEGEEPEKPEELPSKGKDWIFTLISAVIILAVVGAVAYFNWYNVFVNIGGDLDGYKRIAKRHITPENPVVDLRGIDFKGTRLSIDVMERVAAKLKGREIRTVISDDFTAVNVVKKKFKDFRYIVNIPEKVLERPEHEDSES